MTDWNGTILGPNGVSSRFRPRPSPCLAIGRRLVGCMLQPVSRVLYIHVSYVLEFLGEGEEAALCAVPRRLEYFRRHHPLPLIWVTLWKCGRAAVIFFFFSCMRSSRVAGATAAALRSRLRDTRVARQRTSSLPSAVELRT